jgi:predicted transcriptional regulator
VPRRSRLELYLDVLWAIKRGTTKPTRIMYEANLSWKPLQKILNSMLIQKLVEDVDASDNRDKRTNTIYKITQKGENTITYFSRAQEYLEIEEITKFRPI